MKKRLKIFQTGHYPQGEFSLERVKKIFSGITNPVQGIFSHSSKWITDGKNPVVIGEFSNFSIEGDKVFADIEFNNKGNNYYTDGILKGVSAEIDFTKDKLTKIAVLPMGINPAITGAEFQEIEGITLEFEEVKIVSIAEIIAALATLNVAEISQSDLEALNNQAYKLQDDKWKINKLIEAGYIVQKEFSKEEIENIAKPLGFTLIEFQEPVLKSAEEYRAEARAEIEFEMKRDILIANSKTKFPPAIQEIVEFAIMKAAEEREIIIEFSETEKITRFDKIAAIVSETKKHHTQEIFYKDLEFEEQESVDYMAQAKEATKKIYGGE